MDFIVTPDAPEGAAGIIIWWELRSTINYAELHETWVLEGLDPTHLPSPVSIQAALTRAAKAEMETPRHLVRPLKRKGHWELLLEEVRGEDEDDTTLTRRSIVQGYVRKYDNVPGEGTPVIRILDPELGPEARERILARLPLHREVLVPGDVSEWLTRLVSRPEYRAISLRSRGGFYFIPQDCVELWEQTAEAVGSVSLHQFHAIPALQTDGAVEAILSALRSEAEAEITAIEEYMFRGETSTRGLNAYARKAEEVREKLRHYSALLGAELPDLDDRTLVLSANITAAKLAGHVE